ncbi:MAG: hypothetical protein J6X66_12140 [Lachnospiraceae bacterium]|nr:hypothetical protein [Lachnospiraceae bacterium]
MNPLYRIEKKRLFSLKRYRFLSLALFIGAVAFIVYTKVTFWNDIMYTFRIQDYVLYVFNAAAGVIVLLGLYRFKFTRNSIEQGEINGVSRRGNVIAKWRAGISGLFRLYFIMALLIVALGFVLDAQTTAFQLKAMLISLLMDMIAAIASFSVALFFLFLTAFWLLPVAAYAVLMAAYPILMNRLGVRGYTFFVYTAAKDAYSGFMLGRADLKFIPVFLVYVAVSLILSALVFKFKRKERRRLRDLIKKNKAA